MHTKLLFVSGTDTDVGKTFVSCALLEGFASQGLRVAYWKPVQSGPADSLVVEQESHERWHVVPALRSYVTPASPDQAAKHDQMPQLTLTELIAATASLPQDYDLCIIEGAGGLYVPLNDEGTTWIDFLSHTALPMLLVARSGLGTLNHSSLSLSVAQQHQLRCIGIVLNGPEHSANEQSLQRMWPQLSIHPFAFVNRTPANVDDYQSQAAALANFARDQLQELSTKGMVTNEDIAASDRKHVWHPYTQHATAGTPLIVTGAKGVWLTGADGKKYLDATSSWWVNTIGHGRPEIAAALAQQQQQLDHVMFAGMTHAPAAVLAARLSSALGEGFERVFYSDNGSTAIEVALKIAVQSWLNRGDSTRDQFLCLRGSYHGDTVGAMSVSASGGLHSPYRKLLFTSRELDPVLRHAHAHAHAHADARKSKIDYEQLVDELFTRDSSRLLAVIVEPFVQGAGGMLMHDPEWLRCVCTHARARDIPIIFDEIFVGFGRLGTMFAFEQLGIRPDIICLGKGLTGGTMTLAVTATSETYFSYFLDQDKGKALLHGHSYTANPLACATALATMDIYRREGLATRARHIESRYHAWLEQSSIASQLDDCRVHGSIFAGKLRGTGAADYFAHAGATLTTRGLDHGIYIRPLGNTVYTVPPLTITDIELEQMFDALEKIC